ncbi:FAD-binding oxidoreductase [Rhodococcus sp. ACT016]|uniref:FAD-binding oxidoreductase n=1 Tax=Rhodococcus sp. ACT016 TaxID=3134808 RepID=UPI003D2B474B
MDLSTPSTRTLTPTDIDNLKGAVLGPVFLPDEPGYATEVFAWNVAVTPTPGVVVGATCAADVAAVVRWAGQRGLAVGVQATGHGVLPTSDDTVLISTKRMGEVAVDASSATARVGAGVKWRQVIDAAAPHGLGVVCGSSTAVGVVGFTVGGGVGPLSRTYGFGADNVRRIEVVTADGVVRSVDAEHDPDLFWALRGGKGNFGIVTAIEVGLIALPTLFGGGIFFAAEHTADVLDAYRRWARALPEEMTTSVALLRLPPDPGLPEPLRGRFVVHLRVAYVGPADVGVRLLEPMRAVAPAILDTVGEMPFSAVDAIHQDPVDPMPSCERGALLRELTAETIEALLDVAGPQCDVPLAMVEIRQLGGALDRMPEVPNAAGGRGAAFSLFVIAPLLPELADIAPGLVDAVVASVASSTADGAFVNFLGRASTPADVLGAWAPEDRERLLRIKHLHDPTNVFRAGYALSGDRRTAPVTV